MSTLGKRFGAFTEQPPKHVVAQSFNELRPADIFDVIPWRRRIPKPSAFVAGFEPTLHSSYTIPSFTWPLEPSTVLRDAVIDRLLAVALRASLMCRGRHFCDACTWRPLLMARTLICTLLLLAWNATAWAQILDVRELNTDQIARLDRARTVVLLTAASSKSTDPFSPHTATAIKASSSPRASRKRLLDDRRRRSFGSRRISGQLRRTEVCLSRKLPGPHGDAESGLHGSGD